MPDFTQLTERQREIYDFIKHKIESRGYGESRPIASNGAATGREESRRVEVVIADEGEATSGRRP